jgi:protein TonB
VSPPLIPRPDTEPSVQVLPKKELQTTPLLLSPAGDQPGQNPQPDRYPSEALKRHEQGTVGLSISVDTEGRIIDVEVSRSSGSGSLDQAATDWIRDHWHFPPGKVREYRTEFVYKLL